MSTGLFFGIATLILFAILLFVSGACRGKLFSYLNEAFISKKNAGECVDMMFEHYKINLTPETSGGGSSDFDAETDKTNSEEDDVNDEENEDLDIDDDDDNDFNENDNSNKAKQGRVYEKVESVLSEENTPRRKYDAIEGFDLSGFKYSDVEKKNYKYVEIIKGKLKYKYNENSVAVQMSEDICHSDSMPSNCIAAYCSSKLIESVDKPTVYKAISLLTAIPRFISKFSWFICLAIVFAPLPLSAGVSTAIGLTCFISGLISCLEAIYSFELINITLSNMIETKIITENEALTAKDMLNLIAFIDSTRFLGSFRWFMDKFMGYRL